MIVTKMNVIAARRPPRVPERNRFERPKVAADGRPPYQG